MTGMRACIWYMGIIPIIVSGCILEDPLDTRETCTDMAYILIDVDDQQTEKCTRDSCNKYHSFFSIDKCPAEYPFCIEDKEGNYCASSCVGSTHLLSDDDLEEMANEGMPMPDHLCEPDSVEHCGIHTLDCSNDPEHNPGWVSGYCDTQSKYLYPCVATECKPSYRFDDYNDGVTPPRCVRYSECCGLLCSNCTNYRDATSDPLYNHITCSSKDLNDAVCLEKCPDGHKVCDGLCINSGSACE